MLLSCFALFCFESPLFAQGGKKVSGHVVDDTNEPVIGASVLVVGTGNGVITDFDGNFSLMVQPEDKEIQVSYVGYETQTIAIGDRLRHNP